MIDEASRQTKAYRERGWEILNSSVQRTKVTHHFKGYDKGGELYFEATMNAPTPLRC